VNRASTPVFAVLAAGGTGGHLYPALAVADALVARGHPVESLRLVTDQREVVRAAMARASYAHDELPIAHGLQRGGVDTIGANAAVAMHSITATVVALRLLQRHRPRVAVGFGAYASVPVILAARARRVPIVVHEQNRLPGLANRLAVSLGARAAVSLPGTPLRGAVVTGNPVRAELVNARRRPVQPPLVAFVGASLGAKVLNDTALGLYDRWRARTDVAIHHVTGERYHADCAAALLATRRPGDRLVYELVAYEHDIAALYARASIVIARAGGSVAELAAAAAPAVLVPWSGATDDHQSANARAFAAAGAAVDLPERECDAPRLAAILDDLLADRARLDAMSKAARELARPDAADRVAALIESAAS
jgi:UDP-N-acetylglucosamine--N-acetylmuramyl-(pentapeptide) pyrophosphoryl-undecaprenol N-acetylglucosamine transferase